jgi:hypothetical protein
MTKFKKALVLYYFNTKKYIYIKIHIVNYIIAKILF